MIVPEIQSKIFNHDMWLYISYKDCNFIPIPKNSSTYVESFFDIALGAKTFENFRYGKPLNGKKTIVVLRDPLDRWISGMTEHFCTRHRAINDISNRDLLWSYITNQISLDEHTEIQSRFLESANTDELTFFKQGPDLELSICLFVRNELKINDDAWINKKYLINYNRSSWTKDTIKNYLSTVIDSDLELVESIKKFYKHDYDLINSVKFYKNLEDAT